MWTGCRVLSPGRRCVLIRSDRASPADGCTAPGCRCASPSCPRASPRGHGRLTASDRSAPRCQSAPPPPRAPLSAPRLTAMGGRLVSEEPAQPCPVGRSTPSACRASKGRSICSCTSARSTSWTSCNPRRLRDGEVPRIPGRDAADAPRHRERVPRDGRDARAHQVEDAASRAAPGPGGRRARPRREDPREALIRRLLEYQKYKQAGADLAARGVAGRDIFLARRHLEESVKTGCRRSPRCRSTPSSRRSRGAVAQQGEALARRRRRPHQHERPHRRADRAL